MQQSLGARRSGSSTIKLAVPGSHRSVSRTYTTATEAEMRRLLNGVIRGFARLKGISPQAVEFDITPAAGTR